MENETSARTQGSRTHAPQKRWARTLTGLYLLALVGPVALGSFMTPLAAQEGRAQTESLEASSGATLPLARLNSRIVLDGRIDEAAWSQVTSLRLVMFEPDAGQEPTDRSEVRIAYDSEYLYVSGRFFTDRPQDVTATSLYRDRLGADDIFRVLLDTFDDNENAVVFATNPEGVRVDRSVAADGADSNLDFNTYWDVATRRDDQGWYAEMRIPLSSLRFQVQRGQVVMGLLVSRFSAGKNETSTFPAVQPDFANATSRPSLAQSVSLQGVQAKRATYLTPYTLGGWGSRAEQADDLSPFFRSSKSLGEMGLDAKISLTNNLTLDLTANTDFAQVEVDDDQVNLTRFSLFFPEKRQFFQERSGVFDLATGAGGVDPSLFFHSRRIGLTAAGTPRRIYGGGRLNGRVGEWDVGVLSLQIEGVGGHDSENVGALRLRRRVVNERSTVGAFLTTRLGGMGGRNVAYALDTRINVRGQDYLDLQVSQSFDELAAGGALDAAMVRVAIERPSNLFTRGWGYRAAVKWSGGDYNPALGFNPRRGFSHYLINPRYGIFPTNSSFRSIQPSVVASIYTRNDSGSVDSGFYGAFVNYALRSGINGWLGGQLREELLDAPLFFSENVSVPAGRYRFPNIQFAVFPAQGSRIRVPLQLQVGKLFDGVQLSATISTEWDASRHLQLGAEYTFDRIRFSDRGETLRADLARLRVQGSLDTHVSVTASLQYNRLQDQVGANARIRYHFTEGRDLWLVFNDALNVDRDRTMPMLPLSQRRAVLLKYSHTLGVGR